jgi:hypothetical protein
VFWRWLTEPLPAQFLALGLLLTAGRFNAEIPIDRRCVSSIQFLSKLVYAPEQMYGPPPGRFRKSLAIPIWQWYSTLTKGLTLSRHANRATPKTIPY